VLSYVKKTLIPSVNGKKPKSAWNLKHNDLEFLGGFKPDIVVVPRKAKTSTIYNCLAIGDVKGSGTDSFAPAHKRQVIRYALRQMDAVPYIRSVIVFLENAKNEQFFKVTPVRKRSTKKTTTTTTTKRKQQKKNKKKKCTGTDKFLPPTRVRLLVTKIRPDRWPIAVSKF
jgi:hypothetical protein